MVPEDLRPLAIGELIDRAAVLWRTHFWALLRLYLPLQLTIYALSKAFALSVAAWAPAFAGGLDASAVEADPFALVSQLAVLAVGGVLLLLLTTLGTWFIAVAATHYVVKVRLGEPVGVPEAFARAWHRAGSLTWAYLLSLGWTAAVFAASVVPGVAVLGLGLLAPASLRWLAFLSVPLLLLGPLIAVLWYVLRFFLTAQVVAAEDGSAWDALGRSGELVSGRVGEGLLNLVKVRATILLTVAFAILLVVSLVTGLPALVMGGLAAAESSGTQVPQISQWVLVPAALLQALAQAAFAPLLHVIAALFYLDMRVRREGLDVEVFLARQGVR
jgi:hypothetical protein